MSTSKRLKPTSKQLEQAIKKHANPLKAVFLQRYFKTGKGEYAEGDKFLGLTVPQSRKIAHEFRDLDLKSLTKFMTHKVHEYRFIALEILVAKYEHAEKLNAKNKNSRKKEIQDSEKIQRDIFKFYLQNRKYINNWDLVDTSAEYIVGAYLKDRPKELLYKLATSKSVWDRRIAIISTFHYIKNGDHYETLKIAQMLLKDSHDLIHKAVGWMLREVGKKSEKTLVQFLDKHSKVMPRTMLRYAIERFPAELRHIYLDRS